MIATYGDLVGAAGVDIHTGLLRVMRRGFVDHKQAQNTVGVYYDLLAALRSHTWWLIDPARARGEELARAMHRKPDDSDLDMVAARLFAGFGPLAQRPVWLPYPDPDFDHPWRDAADKIAGQRGAWMRMRFAAAGKPPARSANETEKPAAVAAAEKTTNE